ncbi:MAG: NGG1p interacting factor NIF3 [Candidatus Curtissbacteria bacterium]|nr:NGG1p interacting factor NIF3 [Candidatus Curtissbacteria bacterium]
MTIRDIYELAVKMGMDADPRGKDGVKSHLARMEKLYQDLPKTKKAEFDLETLRNPYSDTRILFGSPSVNVDAVMAGIDAGGTEVLLTDRLNQKGEGIDLLISHHPSGHALASLHEVMDLQVETFANAGVPENVAQALLADSMGYIKRRFGPLNHSQTVDAARLLGVPLLALHTVWDNMGDAFMKNYLADKKLTTVGDVMEVICEIPEFKEAIKGKAGPSIVSGGEKSRVGKILITLTGGTNPQKDLYMELAKAGVGTLIEMHIPEDSVEELRKAHINAIDIGHMAADSIGANLFLDELEKRGVKVLPASGLIRVKRSTTKSSGKKK